MARKTVIDRLPEDIREKIGKLRGRGRSLDEIRAKLDELDVEYGSRATLGRHLKKIDKVSEELNRSKQMAEAIVARFGDAPESKTAQLNLEIMHSLVQKALFAETGGLVSFEPHQVKAMSEALRNLATAEKTHTDRLIKVRREIATEAAKVVDDVAAEAIDAGEQGLSAARVAQLRRDILGVGQKAA